MLYKVDAILTDIVGKLVIQQGIQEYEVSLVNHQITYDKSNKVYCDKCYHLIFFQVFHNSNSKD